MEFDDVNVDFQLKKKTMAWIKIPLADEFVQNAQYTHKKAIQKKKFAFFFFFSFLFFRNDM